MNEKADTQLLCDFAWRGDESAFREIVRRYTDLVYSAALRQVASAAAAGDVAQSVFIDLARKAGALTQGGAGSLPPSLAGWLHRATRYAALNHLRDARRRLSNERQAMEQLLTNSESPADWEQIRPALDEALDSLGDEDREALLLRYFKNQDFRAVGLALGVSDDAAQKRVSRAVEQLREFFSKRNVSIGAGGLAVLISVNAVQAAPAGLAMTMSAGALAGTAVTASTAIAITKTIAMTTLQKTAIAATFTVTAAVLAGTGIYEAGQAAHLRGQNQTLQQAVTPLTAQIRQLQAERDQATNRVAELLAGNATPATGSNDLELLKLRGEVARLRGDSQELARMKAAAGRKSTDPLAGAAQDLLNKEELIKQKLAEMPDKDIPELQYLPASAWARIAQNARLDTDEDVRQTLSELRDIAKQIVAPKIGNALGQYVAANNGQLPADTSQLQPYFASMDPAVLARYQMTKSGNVADLQPNDMIVTEKNDVDDDYDNLFEIGLNSRRSHGVGRNSGNSGTGSWASDESKVHTTNN